MRINLLKIMKQKKLPKLTPEQEKYQMELSRKMSPTAKMFPPKGNTQEKAKSPK